MAERPTKQRLDDKIMRLESKVTERPLKQIQDATRGPRSGYNETVRANNRRADKGRPGKSLPKGRYASEAYDKSRGGKAGTPQIRPSKKLRSSGR